MAEFSLIQTLSADKKTFLGSKDKYGQLEEIYCRHGRIVRIGGLSDPSSPIVGTGRRDPLIATLNPKIVSKIGV